MKIEDQRDCDAIIRIAERKLRIEKSQQYFRLWHQPEGDGKTCMDILEIEAISLDKELKEVLRSRDERNKNGVQ